MDGLYTHNGQPLDMTTTSDRVSDPISGKSVKMQIDQLALQISSIIADSDSADSNVPINIVTVNGLKVANKCSSDTSSKTYYTRIIPNKEYVIDVDITGSYSRMGITNVVPASEVQTVGYTAGGASTKKYRIFIDKQGSGTVYVNDNTEPKSTFEADITKELYLAISIVPEYLTLVDIHFPDKSEEDTLNSFLSIDNQLKNINWNRNKFDSKTLLWFTDCHAIDSEADNSWLPQLQATMDFAKKHKGSIDDIIHTGDCVRNNSSEWLDGDNWVNAGASEVLNVIGNHDVLLTGNTGSLTAAETYSFYMKPFISQWDVTHDGDEEHCYYYKDYSNGLRLIVLDQLRSTAQGSAQLTWFTETLEDAKTQEKHVVVAAHYIPTNSPTKIASNFCALRNSFSSQTNTSILNAIDDYIEDGGIFVCWMVGHCHADYLFKIPEHSNQVVICQDCLACRVDSTADRDRKKGTYTELCFNLITFDTSNRAINIARVGYQYDMFNRHKGGITLDYNGNIYSEW